MRRILPLLLVFLLVFAACGGDDGDDADAESAADAETCEQLGDLFIKDTQTLLDELSTMDLAEFTSEDEPEALTNFQSSIEEISSKSDELECSDEKLEQILTERVDELEAEGPVAELVLQSFQEGIESGEIFTNP